MEIFFLWRAAALSADEVGDAAIRWVVVEEEPDDKDDDAGLMLV
jgi:hypothetical protein